MTLRAPIAGPVAAWARAGGADGLRWLERAARLAPNDPRIALDLALKNLGAAPREAEAGLAALAATYDVATIWLGLALARQRCGDVAGAEAPCPLCWSAIASRKRPALPRWPIGSRNKPVMAAGKG